MRIQINMLSKFSENNNEIVADIVSLDDIFLEDDRGFLKSLKETQTEFEDNFSDEYTEKNWDFLKEDALKDLTFNDYEASDIKHELKLMIKKELEPNNQWRDLRSYLPIDELILWLEKEGLVKAIVGDLCRE